MRLSGIKEETSSQINQQMEQVAKMLRKTWRGCGGGEEGVGKQAWGWGLVVCRFPRAAGTGRDGPSHPLTALGLKPDTGCLQGWASSQPLETPAVPGIPQLRCALPAQLPSSRGHLPLCPSHSLVLGSILNPSYKGACNGGSGPPS